MSDLPSAGYSRSADIVAIQLRALVFDAFELTGLGIFVAAIALMAKWAGA